MNVVIFTLELYQRRKIIYEGWKLCLKELFKALIWLLKHFNKWFTYLVKLLIFKETVLNMYGLFIFYKREKIS